MLKSVLPVGAPTDSVYRVYSAVTHQQGHGWGMLEGDLWEIKLAKIFNGPRPSQRQPRAR